MDEKAVCLCLCLCLCLCVCLCVPALEPRDTGDASGAEPDPPHGSQVERRGEETQERRDLSIII